jgi:hypothetical protein
LKVQRGKDPGPYTKHSQYKPHLKVCFFERCAYCQVPDEYASGVDGMTVDHFLNQNEFPEHRTTWSNLYYCCTVCNSHYKRDHPTRQELLQGIRFVDPCSEDPDDHFCMTRDLQTGDYCKIKPLSSPAAYMCQLLKFNARKTLRDFWRAIERLEHEEEENLASCLATIKDIKMDIRLRGSSDETKQVLKRTKSASELSRNRLIAIRARRPFPTE